MASKAKSGLSAVRQFSESVISPPNAYTTGTPSFTSAIRDGKGHAEYHVGVVNATPFTLQIQHSWRSTGVFTEDQTISSVLDPVTGGHIAELIAPVTKRFIKAVVTVPPPGLAANFEIGLYFQPRASGPLVSSSGGGGGGASVIVADEVPGTVITTPADTAVGVGATVALPAIPSGVRRMTVQVTDGSSTTHIRVREVGGLAGSGKRLDLSGSTMYGGAAGAIAALEVENIAGPAAAVMVQFERD
jgi:hypothetical protein